MSEKLVHNGIILSGGSIIISGILMVSVILSMNAGERPGPVIYLLPVMAVLLVAGAAAIIYGTQEE